MEIISKPSCRNSRAAGQGGRLWACPRVWLSARLLVLSSLSPASGSYSYILSEWISTSFFYNFQRRMSRLEQRWRAQRSVISIVNCRIPWTNRDLNVHCAFGISLKACLLQCLLHLMPASNSTSCGLGTCASLCVRVLCPWRIQCMGICLRCTTC